MASCTYSLAEEAFVWFFPYLFPQRMRRAHNLRPFSDHIFAQPSPSSIQKHANLYPQLWESCLLRRRIMINQHKSTMVSWFFLITATLDPCIAPAAAKMKSSCGSLTCQGRSHPRDLRGKRAGCKTLFM